GTEQQGLLRQVESRRPPACTAPVERLEDRIGLLAPHTHVLRRKVPVHQGARHLLALPLYLTPVAGQHLALLEDRLEDRHVCVREGRLAKVEPAARLRRRPMFTVAASPTVG